MVVRLMQSPWCPGKPALAFSIHRVRLLETRRFQASHYTGSLRCRGLAQPWGGSGSVVAATWGYVARSFI